MKFTILQISSQYICLTPAETVKAKYTGEKRKRSLFAQPGSQTVFGPSLIFALPQELKDDPLHDGSRFAEFVLSCGRQAGFSMEDIILCPDRQNIVTKEYQHAAAKEKFVHSFAVLETESVISDDVADYSIISCEYGSEHGKTTNSNELNAALFAMPLSLIEALKKAFEEQHMRIYRIIPPGAAILRGARRIVNSINLVAAILSLDACDMRITVVKNGAILYSQSFDSPVGDFAQVVAKIRGISLTDAVQAVNEEGILEIMENLQSPQAVRSLQTILDYATGDILRNLRMVLGSQRLELDKIYLADHFAGLPNLPKYLRELGFSMEIDSVDTSYTPENIPIITDVAVENGYRSSSYYMLSGLVALANAGQCDFLNGIHSAKRRSSNIGKYATIALGATVSAVMLAVGGLYGFSYLQQAIDYSKLSDPQYAEVREWIAKDQELSTRIANVESDKAALPQAPAAVREIVSQLYTQITDEVFFVNSYSINNDENLITLNFYVDDFDAYVKLKAEVERNAYFTIAIPFSYTSNPEQGNGSCTVTLSVNTQNFRGESVQSMQGGAGQ